MTQPLPNLPAPAPATHTAKVDASRTNTDDGFDDMFREQLKPVAQESDGRSVTEGGEPEAGAGETAQSEIAAESSPLQPVESAHGPHLIEELAEAPEPDAGLLLHATPEPAAITVAVAPIVVSDGAKTPGETAGDRLARPPGEGSSVPAALIAGKEARGRDPRAAGPQPGPPVMESVVRPAVESPPASRLVMPGSGDLAPEPAESPAQARAGAAAQAVTSFATTLQSATSALPRVQILEPVTVPVADPQWGAAVGARLAVSVAQGVHSASIALNPQELGPLQLTLRVNEDEASVTFVSNHAAVRDAVEAALPRLREMLAAEGINLGDVDVFSSGDGTAQRHAGMTEHPGAAEADDDAAPTDAASQPVTASRHALVDTFA